MLFSSGSMQPFRQSSLVQQPDGEIISAIVDQGSMSEAELGIQFDLGMLGCKVAQEEILSVEPASSQAPQQSSTAVLEPARDTSSKPRQLTVTTARRSIVSGSTLAQPAITSSTSAQQPDAKVSKQLIPAQLAARKQRVRRELPTVSSVSPEAIPGLRRQASTVDPEQAKQLEKGWGLAFKDPSVAVPVRKEVEVSSPHEDNLERVRQITLEKQALAQQRAQADRAKQEAEAEQVEAAKQAKAAAKRATVEAAAAQRAQEVRKRQEFMQETNKMYKATKQQEEQHTPAFLRMQQQADVKEAEEEAEKKRIWEEEVASKKFWFKDIQGSLEGPHKGQVDGATEGQNPHVPPCDPKGSPSLSDAPALSPEASAGNLLGEASQGSLGTASGDEQKKRAKREWQQSLRNSGKFKSGDAQRGPWGLSTHSPKLERRLKYHQMQDRGCSPMEGSGLDTDAQEGLLASGSLPKQALDPLDESNSLSDLTRSLQDLPSSVQSAPEQPSPADTTQRGPLVKLMHSLVSTQGGTSAHAKDAQEPAYGHAHAAAADIAAANGQAGEVMENGSEGTESAVGSSSSNSRPGGLVRQGTQGLSVANAKHQQMYSQDYYREWFTWSNAAAGHDDASNAAAPSRSSSTVRPDLLITQGTQELSGVSAKHQQVFSEDYYRKWFTWSSGVED